MPHKDIEPVSKQLTIVIGLTVVGFMAFGLALSFYRNILFEKTLQDLQAENNRIAGKVQEGYSDLEYYRSTQYKDKFAKENLNKLNRGETMIVMTTPTIDPTLSVQTDTLAKERIDAAYLELLGQMPVIDHWNIFLFHRDQIDALKRGLIENLNKAQK